MSTTIEEPKTDPVTLREITEEQLYLESLLASAYDETEDGAQSKDPQVVADAEAGRKAVEEALSEFLTANQAAGTAKVEAYCNVIKRLEAQASVRKQEADRIARLAKVDENKFKALKARLVDYMDTTKRPKIETKLFKLSLCGNGGKPSLLINDGYQQHPDTLPEAYRTTVIVPDVETIRPLAEEYKALCDALDVAFKALQAADEGDPKRRALDTEVTNCNWKVVNHPMHGIATVADRGKHVRIA